MATVYGSNCLEQPAITVERTFVPYAESIDCVAGNVTLTALFDHSDKWAIEVVVAYDRSANEVTKYTAHWLKPVAVPLYAMPLGIGAAARLSAEAGFAEIVNALAADCETIMTSVDLILRRSTFR